MRLEPHQLEEVRRILAFWSSGIEAYAFGSRVQGRGLKPVSDLDICLKGKGPIPASTLRQVRNAFEISDLPMRVDVVDWNAVAADFNAIKNEMEKL
jgi:predicted nucleotidyltransferase